jgi:hypothetical protein
MNFLLSFSIRLNVCPFPFAENPTETKSPPELVGWCEADLVGNKKLAAQLRPRAGKATSTATENRGAEAGGVESLRVETGEHQNARLRLTKSGVNLTCL